MSEIKIKDEQIFEIKDKAETYRSNVQEYQRKEEKLKSELRQTKDEIQNYQQQTSRTVGERNDLTMELSTLRTKVVNLNTALDSYKTSIMEQYNIVHEHQKSIRKCVGYDET